MSTSRQGTGSSWETEVLEVADRETLYSALFRLLAEEGYFGVDARTLQSPNHSPTFRDQSLARALAQFVHTLPSPVPGKEKTLQRSPEFDESKRRLDALLTGCSEGLLEYIRATPTLAYSYWPAKMIVAAKAREGWQLTTTKAIVVQGMELGTAYTFRRATSSASSPKGGGVLFDPVRGKSSIADDSAVAASMLYNEGNALGREGRFEEAVQRYEAALQIDPSDASVYNNMATAYKNLGRLSEAEATYRRALEADPAYYRAHFRLACVQVLQGKTQDAQAALQEYLRAGATMAEAETLLAELDEADDVRRLIAQIESKPQTMEEGAMRNTGQHSDAERKVSKAMKVMDSKPESAAEMLRAAIALEPELGLAYRELGRVLFALGSFEEALRVSEQATRLLPSDAEAWALYGERCVNRFHMDQALAAHERAYRLDPGNYRANVGLGGFLTSMIEVGKARQRTREAERCLKRAMELDPSQILPYNFLGRLYKASGEQEKAREIYERWQKVHPKNPVPQQEKRKLKPDQDRGFFGRLFRRGK